MMDKLGIMINALPLSKESMMQMINLSKAPIFTFCCSVCALSDHNGNLNGIDRRGNI